MTKGSYSCERRKLEGTKECKLKTDVMGERLQALLKGGVRLRDSGERQARDYNISIPFILSSCTTYFKL